MIAILARERQCYAGPRGTSVSRDLGVSNRIECDAPVSALQFGRIQRFIGC
jgi:hypothetical protein